MASPRGCGLLRATALAALLATGMAGCHEGPLTAPDPIDPFRAQAKPAAAPVVTATDPPYGHQGDLGLVVGISGSGFGSDAVASWERNGAPDPKVNVRSTRYISSTQLEATIDIALDATIAFYDVAVVTKGKKGIGTERFEVSQAIAIESEGLIRDVNANGEMTGQGPFFWSPETGLEMLGSSGSGWGVSDDGLTVVGGVGGASAASTIPVVWTRSGSGWVQASLPRSAGAGNARTVLSDPATGAAAIVGGVETFLLKGNKFRREPRLWLRSGGAWQLTALPGTGGTNEGQVSDLNAARVVVGNTSGGATVWQPNGSGGWTAVLIGPAGSDADAINSAGTLAVGQYGGVAVYWQMTGATWTGPFTLPGGCQLATDVDDLGRIVASFCPVTGTRITGAVILPPYDAASVTFLSGFGDRTDGAAAEAISPEGHWIVGRASLRGFTAGAYWNLF